MIAVNDPPKCLARRQWLPIARIRISNLSLRDDHQRDLVNPILPRPIEKMNAAAEQIGLITRFTVEGDDSAIRNRSFARPFFSMIPTQLLGMDRMPRKMEIKMSATIAPTTHQTSGGTDKVPDISARHRGRRTRGKTPSYGPPSELRCELEDIVATGNSLQENSALESPGLFGGVCAKGSYESRNDICHRSTADQFRSRTPAAHAVGFPGLK